MLGLLVLDFTPGGGRSLVAGRVVRDDAVLPRAVGEIAVPVQGDGGLLVSVQSFQVVGIVLRDVIARGGLRQNDNA